MKIALTYANKMQFIFLKTIFLKIYQKNNDLCDKLIEIFHRIDDKENTFRLNDLKKEVKSFKDIYSNAQNILEENKHNPIHPHGDLFWYLHYYDRVNFQKMIEEFSVGNLDTLYEILIHYYSHFMIPLNQSQQFYNGFVRYALKKEKDLKKFKLILNYVEDIETFFCSL